MGSTPLCYCTTASLLTELQYRFAVTNEWNLAEDIREIKELLTPEQLEYQVSPDD